MLMYVKRWITVNSQHPDGRQRSNLNGIQIIHLMHIATWEYLIIYVCVYGLCVHVHMYVCVRAMHCV